ncbi:hypothetical protein RND81_10G178800 [Saponaria officinalis]|uniref:GRF-type domain-containing protein n=1 Tax=Saponaria officinalis TaxID=3572 RepID=A0AAW1I422_SAPOF
MSHFGGSLFHFRLLHKFVLIFQIVSTSSTPSSLSAHIRKKCHCGFPAAMKTSWTVHNSGRRFFTCKLYDPDLGMPGCNFFKWVILELLNENKRLKDELKQRKEQESDDQKLEKKIVELGVELEKIRKEKKNNFIICLVFVVIFLLFGKLR